MVSCCGCAPELINACGSGAPVGVTAVWITALLIVGLGVSARAISEMPARWRYFTIIDAMNETCRKAEPQTNAPDTAARRATTGGHQRISIGMP